MSASSAGNTIRNMHTVNNDSRIIMNSVLDYDVKAGTYVFAPGGKELVFQNETELIRCLASHTDTHGYADPARWSNNLILRQISKGRKARTWKIQIGWNTVRTENWDYWFHDAHGRTIDVRDYWPAVIAAVRRGNLAKVKRAEWQGHHIQRTKGHTSCCGRRKGCAGALVRASVEEKYYDEEGHLIYHQKPRGKLLETLFIVDDFDFPYEGRSRHSTGWKHYKGRHQWEHKAREQERHQKNHIRKALHRGDYCIGKDE